MQLSWISVISTTLLFIISISSSGIQKFFATKKTIKSLEANFHQIIIDPQWILEKTSTSHNHQIFVFSNGKFLKTTLKMNCNEKLNPQLVNTMEERNKWDMFEIKEMESRVELSLDGSDYLNRTIFSSTLFGCILDESGNIDYAWAITELEDHFIVTHIINIDSFASVTIERLIQCQSRVASLCILPGPSSKILNAISLQKNDIGQIGSDNKAIIISGKKWMVVKTYFTLFHNFILTSKPWFLVFILLRFLLKRK